MGKKYYAVKEGFNSETGEKIENKIVTTWAECLKYVKGVKGAKYKSFEDLNSAKDYLQETGKQLKKGSDEIPVGYIHAYVDGSYNEATGKYSYGVVIVKNDVIIHIENGAAKDDREKALRQIAGELAASVKAVEYAILNSENKLAIIHDYEGIFHHAAGSWERRDKSSKEYYEYMNKYLNSKDIDIIFVKVDSHTGDLFNEIADEEAKIAAGLKLNSVTKKYLTSGTIKTRNDTVKNKITELISEQDNANIIVVDERDAAAGLTDEKVSFYIKDIKKALDKNEETALALIDNLQDNIKSKLILKLIKLQ